LQRLKSPGKSAVNGIGASGREQGWPVRNLSIKWRAAIAATVSAVALIVLVSAIQLHFLRKDLSAVLFDTQFAMVSRVAAEVDNQLAMHLEMLARVARATPQPLPTTADGMRAWWRKQSMLPVMFDDVVLCTPDGLAIADLPAMPQRVKMNIADRLYFQEVMRTGKAVISDPVFGRSSNEPAVLMATPVFADDGSGRILAVLIGSLRLNKANFLAGLASAKAGKSGYFTIITKGPNPSYVVHPDVNRMSRPRPPDMHGAADRALAGFEGSMEEVSSTGVRGLYSFKSLRTANWVLGAAIPAVEAFAPLAEAEQRTYFVSTLVALIVAPLVWFAVWRLLSPLSSLRDAMFRLRAGGAAFVPVPVARRDEIGDLAADFNILMQARESSEGRLRESENRLRMIADNMPALISYVDRHLRFRFTNKAYSDWFGFDADHLLGCSVKDFVGGGIFTAIKPHLEAALAGERVTFEHVMFTPGVKRMVEVTLVPHSNQDGEVVGAYTLILDITRQKEVENMLRRLARFDTLTQLPNRHYFEEHLADAILRSERTRSVLALMFLDVDHFKAINDGFGHEAGDEVLREFAKRVSTAVRSTDTVARLAGDEFVVILEGMHDAAETEVVARKILTALEPEFKVRTGALNVSSSIGIAVRKLGQMDGGELLRQADAALYAAKREGRNRFHLDHPGDRGADGFLPPRLVVG
jgi:diguanylate cyclase (GGDEF)-like protein/PAS domain S-box-containing protein